MCGRFAQFSDPDALAQAFGLETVDLDAPARYNLAPTEPVLAVRLAGDGQRRELVRLRWGLVPFWSKGPDSRYSMINARAETVVTKPAYRAAFKQRRCLIPADAFYEWQPGKDGKQPYAIRREDRAPFAMAGLWEHWQGDDGTTIASCTIIVTEANALLAPIHDRMPMILEPVHFGAWLGSDGEHPDALQRLLVPADPSGWEAYPIARAVNSPSNEGPALLAPTTAASSSHA